MDCPCGTARADNPQHRLDKKPVVLAAAPRITGLAQTTRLHLRPLGVRQHKASHPRRESQPSTDENRESQQTLAHWGFVLNDGKHFTPTIDGMGFRALPREAFTGLCQDHGRASFRVGRWSMETDLATVSTWKPEETGALRLAA